MCVCREQQGGTEGAADDRGTQRICAVRAIDEVSFRTQQGKSQLTNGADVRCTCSTALHADHSMTVISHANHVYIHALKAPIPIVESDNRYHLVLEAKRNVTCQTSRKAIIYGAHDNLKAHTEDDTFP